MFRRCVLLSALVLLVACLLSTGVAALRLRSKHSHTHGRQPVTAPDAYSYELVTFELQDTGCSAGPTGGISFAADTCALTPSSVTAFHSLQLTNVVGTSGNY